MERHWHLGWGEDEEEGWEPWPPDEIEDETSEELLTYEEQLVIRQVAEEAKTMDRQQLTQALLACWGEKFALRRALSEVADEHELPIKVRGPMLIREPGTREEFREVFGYVPTEQEARDFLEELHETATMELDMERIVDSVE